MANAFVHTELNTTDVGKAKEFYGQLFDWKLEDMAGGMDYTLIKTGDNSIGGIMKHPMPGAPSIWISYVLVDDIHASTAKAKSTSVIHVRPKRARSIVVFAPISTSSSIWTMPICATFS